MRVSSENIKQATVQGAIWNFATFLGSKALAFVTTIVLARLLSPEDFGLLALGMIAINYIDTIDDFGVADALVYRQNDPNRAYSVAFFINLATGSLATILGLLVAPFVAIFFSEPRVVPVLQVLAFSFVISSVGNLLESRFRKELDFRTKFYVDVSKTVVKGGVSISLALLGHGVWSLVWGQLAGAFASTMLFWIRSRWWPNLIFDLKIAKSLYSFGSQMILVELLGMVHKNIDYLIIGFRLDAIQLGFYTMAFRLPELVIMNICYIFGKTLFPAYAKLQNQMDDLRTGYLKSTEYLALVTIPAGLLMFLIAPEFVTLFFGEKWLSTIPILQVLSLYAIIYSLSFNAGNIYKATGRPVILNQLGVLKLVITVPVLWLAAPYGIYFVGLAQVATTALLTIVRLIVARHVINLRWLQLFRAYRSAAIASVIMFSGAYFLRLLLLPFSLLLNMISVALLSLCLYIGSLWLINRKLVLKLADSILSSLFRHDAVPAQGASGINKHG